MRKKYFFIAGILLLCLAGWGFYLYHKPHTGVNGIKPVAVLTATQLYTSFQQDESKANQLFLDKVILVNGVVEEIAQTDSTLTIQLQSGSITGGINCSLSVKENSNKGMPVKGSSVAVKGKCTGFLMDVNLVDGVLE